MKIAHERFPPVIDYGPIISVVEEDHTLKAAAGDGYILVLTDDEFEMLYAAYVGNEPFTLEELVGSPKED